MLDYFITKDSGSNQTSDFDPKLNTTIACSNVKVCGEDEFLSRLPCLSLEDFHPLLEYPASVLGPSTSRLFLLIKISVL